MAGASIAVALLWGTTAGAEPPRPLTAVVDDGSDLLSDAEEAALTADINALRGATGVQVYFAFPQSFSGVSAWAQQSAQQTDYPGTMMAVALSVDDGRASWAASNDFPMTKEAIDDIMQAFTYPSWEDYRIAYGCYQLLEGLAYQLGGGSLPVPIGTDGIADPTPTPEPAAATPTALESLETEAPATFTPSPEPPSAAADDDGAVPTPTITQLAGSDMPGMPALALIVIAVALVLVRVAITVRRRHGQEPARPAKVKLPALGDARRQAGQALVQADGSVQAAKAEVAFAEARFTLEETADLRVAVREAEQQLTRLYAAHEQAEAAGTRRDKTAKYLMVSGQCAQMVDELTQHVRQVAALSVPPDQVGETLDDLQTQLERLGATLPKVKAQVAAAVSRTPAAASGAQDGVVRAERSCQAATDLLHEAREAQRAGDLAAAGAHAHRAAAQVAAATAQRDEAAAIAQAATTGRA